jgi:hypothetical protein
MTVTLHWFLPTHGDSRADLILSGYPHLEECYRVGEGVIPVLRRRGLLAGADLTTNHWRYEMEAERFGREVIPMVHQMEVDNGFDPPPVADPMGGRSAELSVAG